MKAQISIISFLAASIPVTQAVRTVVDVSLLGTAPFILIVLLSYASALNKRVRFDANYLIIILLFLWLMLLGVLYSRAPMYGISKVLFTFFYYVIFGLALLILLDSQRAISAFLLGLFWGSCIAVLLYLILLGSPLALINSWAKFDRLKLGEGNPIIFSQNIGIGLILSISIVLQNVHGLISRILGLGIVFLSLLFMILSGSKGPLVGVVLSICYLLAVSGVNKRTLLFYSMSGAAVIFFQTKILGSISEFLTLRYNFDYSFSVSSRLDLYSVALSTFRDGNLMEVLIGHGTGDFGYVLNGVDLRGYPHNVFVEALYEFGLLGFAVYTVVIVYPILTSLKKPPYISPGRKSELVYRVQHTATALYLFAVVCAQFTSDIGKTYNISLFAMLLLSISALSQKKLLREF